MEIRLANPDEFERVRDFYFDLIKAMQDNPYLPGWEVEVYPTSSDLQHYVNEQQLYVGEEEGRLCGAMVLNHSCNEGYAGCPWKVDAAPDEVTIIHILCVHPDFSRRGLGKQLVRHAIKTARAQNQKVLRLDVLKGNVPAERLYPHMGFELLQTVPMFYEDTGWTDYELYELVL